jgi:hypothetical protein
VRNSLGVPFSLLFITAPLTAFIVRFDLSCSVGSLICVSLLAHLLLFNFSRSHLLCTDRFIPPERFESVPNHLRWFRPRKRSALGRVVPMDVSVHCSLSFSPPLLWNELGLELTTPLCYVFLILSLLQLSSVLRLPHQRSDPSRGSNFRVPRCRRRREESMRREQGRPVFLVQPVTDRSGELTCSGSVRCALEGLGRSGNLDQHQHRDLVRWSRRTFPCVRPVVSVPFLMTVTL